MSEEFDRRPTEETGPRGRLVFWRAQLDLAGEIERDWREDRAPSIIERYRDDERSVISHRADHRFNILWANTEILRASIFSATPRPDVRRKFHDKDPAGRQAARIIERVLDNIVQDEDFDPELEAVVLDGLLVGRGTVRLRYSERRGDRESEEAIADQRLWVEYVDWRDIRTDPARRESEITWKAFRHEMDQDQLIEEFGEDRGRRVPLDKAANMPERDDEVSASVMRKAEVWEIWDKETRQVRWLSALNEWLSVEEDPLGLSGFFPVPSPYQPIRTNDTLVPVPEFTLYQDQADELDLVTRRINSLTEKARLRGIYAGSEKQLVAQLLDASGPDIVGVEDYGAILDKGGLKGIIEWLPLNHIATLLQGLYTAREHLKVVIHEITGISDLMRGATKASETLGAQQFKANFGQIRMIPRRRPLERFIVDLLRMFAEVAAERFTPGTLFRMTGLEADEETLDLLRRERLREFRIRIETDSTVQADATGEQESRVQFLTAVTQFLQTAGPMVAEGTLPIGVAKSLLMFGARGFKIGREVEEELEQLGENQGPNQAAQQKDRDAEALQQEMQFKIADMQAKQEIDVAKVQLDKQRVVNDAQRVQIENQRLQLELMKVQGQTEAAQAKLVSDERREGARLDVDRQKLQVDDDFRRAEGIDKIALERDKLNLEDESLHLEDDFRRGDSSQSRRLERMKLGIEQPRPDIRRVKKHIHIRKDGNVFHVVTEEVEETIEDGIAERSEGAQELIAVRNEDGSVTVSGEGTSEPQEQEN